MWPFIWLNLKFSTCFTTWFLFNVRIVARKRLLIWLLVSPCGYNYEASFMLRVFSHFQEAIVTSEEIGKDYEHVEAQRKKFDDFEKVRLVHNT